MYFCWKIKGLYTFEENLSIAVSLYYSEYNVIHLYQIKYNMIAGFKYNLSLKRVFNNS